MIHSPAWLTWPGLAFPPPGGTKVTVNRGRPHPLLALGPRSGGGGGAALQRPLDWAPHTHQGTRNSPHPLGGRHLPSNPNGRSSLEAPQVPPKLEVPASWGVGGTATGQAQDSPGESPPAGTARSPRFCFEKGEVWMLACTRPYLNVGQKLK